METFVDCVKAWQRGEVTLEEAVAVAVAIPVSQRKHDGEGETYFEGSAENTAYGVTLAFPRNVADEFLTALAEAL